MFKDNKLKDLKAKGCQKRLFPPHFTCIISFAKRGVFFLMGCLHFCPPGLAWWPLSNHLYHASSGEKALAGRVFFCKNAQRPGSELAVRQIRHACSELASTAKRLLAQEVFETQTKRCVCSALFCWICECFWCLACCPFFWPSLHNPCWTQNQRLEN